MSPVSRDGSVAVDRLCVEDRNGRAVLREVTFSLRHGDRLGIVGESGAGKTTLALALLGHFRPGLRCTSGSIRVADRHILASSRRERRACRQSIISYLGQDPAAALTPNVRIGDQVRELLRGNRDAAAASTRLAAVGLPSDKAFARRYPHEVSGGQLQRVAIARALAPDPAVLVLDEPTAALDLVTRRAITEEIERQVDLRGITLVLIAHDLSLVARAANRLLVLRSGEVVEQGDVATGLSRPRHPYTVELVAACDGDSRPGHASGDARCDAPSALAVRGLVAGFGPRAGRCRVVAGVGFSIDAGECLALIGMSGAGKTTVARCILGLHEPESGSVVVHGRELAPRTQDRPVAARRSIQLVPQDPEGSLNPRRRVGDMLRHALRSMRGRSRRDAEADACALLERVRLSPALLTRFPRELSGGERQRIAIARALAAEPRVLVCDEVTSALDVSVQATVLDLIDQLRRETGMAVLLIAHDLRVVRRIAHRAAVLHHGRVCEQGPIRELFEGPRHEFTRSIVEADRPLSAIFGERLRRGSARRPRYH